jgi:hypothetical protein
VFYLPDKKKADDPRHCNQYGSCDDLEDSDSDFETIDYQKMSDL